MLLDARKLEEVPDELSSKNVIIGAGTVGLFLAVSLARANIPVLLLETGDRVADTAKTRQTAVSVGKHHDGVTLGRSFGLGGTSVLWGGQLAEFEAFDLRAHGNNWPLSYAELRRWYQHVYKFFDVRQDTVEHYRLMFGGETIRPDENIERYFTYWLPQPNFAALFRDEIVSSPFITVVLNATVNDMTFADSIAHHVQAVVPGQRHIRITGETFLFAAGTIETTRFFLSTQRLSDVPWKSNRHIGTYFQDHMAGKIADVQVLDENRLREFFENGFAGGIKLQPKLRLTKEPRERSACGIAGSFAFESSLGEHLHNIKLLIRALKSGRAYSGLGTLPSDIRALGSAFLPLVLRYIRDRRVLAFFDRALEFHVQAEQIPIENSRITLLEEEIQWDGLFRAAIDWHIDGREMHAIKVFARHVDAYLHQNGIARLQLADELLLDNPQFMSGLGDTYHQCGGMRMANDAATGVVDSGCRVWGTKNVFISGACVFPTSSYANCTLTALALAARLADTLMHQK